MLIAVYDSNSTLLGRASRCCGSLTAGSIARLPGTLLMSTSERILNAAAMEFTERGVDGVRMEHVAKRTNVNKALVYRHFGNKVVFQKWTLYLQKGKPNS